MKNKCSEECLKSDKYLYIAILKLTIYSKYNRYFYNEDQSQIRRTACRILYLYSVIIQITGMGVKVYIFIISW